MRRSVIFTPYARQELKYKLRAVNPYFHIVSDIKLSIPNRYWFSGAFQVYDTYNDEKRFLRTINNFTRVCKLEKYFYIDENNCIWETSPMNSQKRLIKNMKIIMDNAHEI